MPNRDNPYDRNANVKANRQRFDHSKVDAKRSNVIALMERERAAYQAGEQAKFGSSAPKRVNEGINVDDILKYTLGVNKDRAG